MVIFKSFISVNIILKGRFFHIFDTIKISLSNYRFKIHSPFKLG